MTAELYHAIIVVDDEPYQVWEVDLPRRNLEFLNSIDPEYFDYIRSTHGESEDKQRASIALRTAYHHALETFFSFVGAYVQAPDCAYGWVSKCSNATLGRVVDRINTGGDDLFTKLNITSASWPEIARLVFECYKPGSNEQNETIDLFAKLWRRLASEFLDERRINEYNSIKHGFRVHSGGFSLRVGREHEYGVAPPESEMKSLGGSEYGTSFFTLEQIGEDRGNRSLKSRQHSLNWRLEKVAILLRLLTHSLSNVLAALKVANGVKPGTVKFTRPAESEIFHKAWSYSSGVTCFNVACQIEDASVPATTRRELIETIESWKKTKE